MWEGKKGNEKTCFYSYIASFSDYQWLLAAEWERNYLYFYYFKYALDHNITVMQLGKKGQCS